MKLGSIVLAACILLPDFAFADPRYNWVVSKSATDPLVQTGVPTGGIDTLYLWFYCGEEGMSTADITLQSDPPGRILDFIPMNGYSNAGSATSLELWVGGCPSPPHVAGSILVDHSSPLRICMDEQAVTVDCAAIPTAWPIDWTGYGDVGLTACSYQDGCHCLKDPTGTSFGACCYPDGSCAQTLLCECPGEWYWLIPCAGVDCGPVSVDANTWGRIKATYR